MTAKRKKTMPEKRSKERELQGFERPPEEKKSRPFPLYFDNVEAVRVMMASRRQEELAGFLTQFLDREASRIAKHLLQREAVHLFMSLGKNWRHVYLLPHAAMGSEENSGCDENYVIVGVSDRGLYWMRLDQIVWKDNGYLRGCLHLTEGEAEDLKIFLMFVAHWIWENR